MALTKLLGLELLSEILTPRKSERALGPSEDELREADLRAKRAATRILIVEDDVVNQLLTSKLVAALGYVADVAGNGEEAIAALRQRSYSLILMDCDMPVMNGHTTTAFIRSAPSLSAFEDIPILALSGLVKRTDKKQCLESGMNEFLAKPVSRHDLGEALDRWLLSNIR